MIKNVLLATDLSLFTPCLLQHAVDLAKNHQAKLVVVHAIEPLGSLGHALLQAYLKPETTRALTTTGLDAMVREVKSQVIDALAEECIEADNDLLQLGEVIVKAGPPVDVILDAAQEVDASLIVVGSHSPNLAYPASLGSVAQKVIHCAKVPVYVIPTSPLVLHRSEVHGQLGLW